MDRWEHTPNLSDFFVPCTNKDRVVRAGKMTQYVKAPAAELEV